MNGQKFKIGQSVSYTSGPFVVRAMPLLDPKIGRGLFTAIALNLVLDGLSLVE